MTKLLGILVATLAMLTLGSLAFAQAPAPPVADVASWPDLALVALVLGAAALRRYTPSTGFFHTPKGALLITGVAFVLEAVAKAVEQQGFNKRVVLHAVISALFSLLAVTNPTMAAQASEEKKLDLPPIPKAGQGGFFVMQAVIIPILWALFALGLALLAGGCANPMQGFKSGLTATAITVSTGYRAADEYDAQKQPTIASKDEFDAYRSKRDVAMKLLRDGADAVRSGDAALKAKDAAARKDWPDLTVKIISIGIQVADALKQWGVNIPGVQ